MVKYFKKNKGFTLIELLVVMAILGILATVGIGSFMTAQLKSRDAKRKADLGQVQRAVEMYMNDKGTYPASLSWGDLFEDTTKRTVYMTKLPKDPSGSPEYCYKIGSPATSYQLYAKLENSRDSGIIPDKPCTVDGIAGNYNYGVSSPNTAP